MNTDMNTERETCRTLQEIDNKYLSGGERGMGTSQYYRRMSGDSVYTDAVKDFMEHAEAQWFYDIIETEIFSVLNKHGIADKYYLILRVENNEAKIRLEDYKQENIHTKEIPFTDLPDGELLFYVTWYRAETESLNSFFEGSRLVTCMPIED